MNDEKIESWGKALIQNNREQLQAAAKQVVKEFGPLLERIEKSSKSLNRATWALVIATFLLVVFASLNMLKGDVSPLPPTPEGALPTELTEPASINSDT